MQRTPRPAALAAAAAAVLLGTAAAVAATAAPPRKAAPKKPAAAKPPAATPPKSAAIVLGTQQMPGDFGQFGQTYTIGKSDPTNFALVSAEYTTQPVNIDGIRYVPKADEKLLVLHYTVHNPRPVEQRYYWAELRFTVVDSRDTNHEYVQAAAREGTPESLGLNLKPGQKVEAWTLLRVPAAGVIPKLIVIREDGAPVIRYDLRGKVKPLPAPYADPADASGATALARIAARAGEVYPLGDFDARLESMSYTAEPLGGNPPEEGKRYLTATFTIKNRSAATQRYYWADFDAEVIDAGGEKVAYNQALLKATRDDAAEGELRPGEEARVRFFAALPQNVAAKTLILREGKEVGMEEARAFAFDVSGAK